VKLDLEFGILVPFGKGAGVPDPDQSVLLKSLERRLVLNRPVSSWFTNLPHCSALQSERGGYSGFFSSQASSHLIV